MRLNHLVKWRLWQNSLKRQTLVGTIIIVILTQLITVALLCALIIFPQMDRNVKLMARDVALLTEIVSSVPDEYRPGLIGKLKTSPEIDLWQGQVPPDNQGPPPRAFEKLIMHALALELNAQDNELQWRTDRERKLWLEIYIGEAPYWISFKRIISFSRANGIILISALLAALFGSLMATALSAKVLSPLNRLKEATDAFSLDKNLPLLDEKGPSEIASLSHSFNNMVRRLIDGDNQRNIVLAGISHDVRTPLTKLRLSLEMMEVKDKKLKSDSERYIDQIDRILSKFMMYARGFEAEPTIELKISKWLKEIAIDHEGLESCIDTVKQTIVVRPEALRRAIDNLINNAQNYGRPPIRMTLNQSDTHIIISIRDHGTGVDPAMIEQIKHPFVRAQNDSQGNINNSAHLIAGSGLGLALVDKIVSLHSGVLELQNLEDGFQARILLPKKKLEK